MRHPWWTLAFAMALAAGCSVPRDQPQAPAAPAAGSLAPASDSTSTLSGLDLLLKAVGGHRLVLLGEIHGTRETPALVGELVDKVSAGGNKAILGLEIVAQDQAGVDRYLHSAGRPLDRAALLSGSHWRDPAHDGRDSAAMFDLIESVRSLGEQGRDIEIVFFDPGDVDDRDRGMADNLRAAIARARQARVLVLTGNVHAMTAAPPWEMFDGGKRIDPPMTAGRLLADLHPFSIDIEAAAGNAWTCTGTCGVHRTFAHGAENAAPALELPDPSESAWDAVLLLPRFSASRPAIEALR